MHPSNMDCTHSYAVEYTGHVRLFCPISNLGDNVNKRPYICLDGSNWLCLSTNFAWSPTHQAPKNAGVPESLEVNGSSSHLSQLDSDATRLRDNLNVIKNFAIIVGTSCLVWVPRAIVSNYLCYQSAPDLRQGHISNVLALLAVLSALIPVVNSLVYATRFKWFRALIRYVNGSISYKECEKLMSDIWAVLF